MDAAGTLRELAGNRVEPEIGRLNECNRFSLLEGVSPYKTHVECREMRKPSPQRIRRAKTYVHL